MFSITPSHIIQHRYCPRFTYFEHVLRIPQFEEKNYKVMRGRHLHEQKLQRNRAYLRKRLGVVQRWDDQYLTHHFLRGVVDEALLLKNGTMAPLDYKFAVYKERLFTTYQTQLYCYAWLIEANFGKAVRQGFLVYTRSQHKVLSVPISDTDKEAVRKSVLDIANIIQHNRFPKATRSKRKCVNCTYRNVCIK